MHGVDRNFHRLEPEPLQRLERGVEPRRLDGHHIARLGHGHQAQVQGVERAVGDDDVVHRLRRAGTEVAQPDLLPQHGVARRQVVHAVPRIELAAGARQRLAEPLPREQFGRGEGGAELHQIALARAIQHGEDQPGHIDLGGHLLRRVRPGRWQHAGGGARDVIAGPLARPHQPALFEPVVGLEGRGRAHAILGHRLADGRQARAGRQRAVADVGGQCLGQRFITFHALGIGANLIR
ncbi:hypothetical protein D3C86_1300930 [compost metagenome]